jgi:GNAT superfamily N-acetyltransferase
VVQPALSVEPALPEDYDRIAELTVGVYVDGRLASDGYTPQLADVAGRASRSELLVARDAAGGIVGSVALVLAGDFGEVTTSDDEAAFRMLVVDPEAQGQDIGQAACTSVWGSAGGRSATGRRCRASTCSSTRATSRDKTPFPTPLARSGRAPEGGSRKDRRDEVALLEHLTLDHVQVLDGAGVLGEHRDLHLHRLEDDQGVARGHLRTPFDQDLPDAGNHLRLDLLDRHRASLALCRPPDRPS